MWLAAAASSMVKRLSSLQKDGRKKEPKSF